MWKKMTFTFSELNLDITLGGGQSFRWSKNPDNEWLGVISGLVCCLKQDINGNLLYKFYGSNTTKNEEASTVSAFPSKKLKRTSEQIKNNLNEEVVFSTSDHENILADYFNFKFPLDKHYTLWGEADENFKKVGKIYKGIRILRQDPVENLFSFICSANNNIPRITSMVEKLCLNYGEKISEVNGRVLHSFPTAGNLAKVEVEQELRKLGFGYRAKYIHQTARMLHIEKSPGWLHNLRNISYKEAHDSLLTLPGVGAKVADCVCLMSLDKYDAVPIDTHIWQVTVKDYMPHLKNTKVLTNRIYQEIGDFYRQRFGEYAGWANTVLFASDLKMFKRKKEVRIH